MSDRFRHMTEPYVSTKAQTFHEMAVTVLEEQSFPSQGKLAIAVAQAIQAAVEAEQEALWQSVKAMTLTMEGKDSSYSHGFMDGSLQCRQAVLNLIRARMEKGE